jgi:hypothetical protein
MSTNVSEVRAASIIRAMIEAALITLIMVAVRTSETSVDICLTTRQNIPEDCELLSHFRDNLKSHM